MQVWIGFKQNEEYVHEWTGEVAGEGDVGKAIGNAHADYRAKAGEALGNVGHGRQSPTAVSNAAPTEALPVVSETVGIDARFHPELNE